MLHALSHSSQFLSISLRKASPKFNCYRRDAEIKRPPSALADPLSGFSSYNSKRMAGETIFSAGKNGSESLESGSCRINSISRNKLPPLESKKLFDY